MQLAMLVLVCLWSISNAIILPPRDNTNFYANVSEVASQFWDFKMFYPGGGGNVHCTPALDDRGNIYWGWGTNWHPVSYTYVALSPQGKPLWTLDLQQLFGFEVNGGCPSIWSSATETKILIAGTAQGSTPYKSVMVSLDGLTGKVLAHGPTAVQNPTQSQYWYGKFTANGEKVLVYSTQAIALFTYPALEFISQTQVNITDKIGYRQLSSVSTLTNPKKPSTTFIAGVYTYQFATPPTSRGFGMFVWLMDENGGLTPQWDEIIDMAVFYPQNNVMVAQGQLFFTAQDTVLNTQVYAIPISSNPPVGTIFRFPILGISLTAVLPSTGIIVTGGNSQNPQYFYGFNGKLLYNQTYNFTGRWNVAVYCSYEDSTQGLTYCIYNDAVTRTSSNIWLRIFTTYDGTKIAESILLDRSTWPVTNPARMIVARAGTKKPYKTVFYAEVANNDVFASPRVYAMPVAFDATLGLLTEN